MVSIVFADMDGTFLSTDKDVPEQNMRLLDELARRDIPFVPCTGRPISAIPAKVLAHAATRYAVGSNGAVVVDAHTGAVLRERGIPKDRVLALYERVRDLNVTFDVFADGAVYSERARYDAMGAYGIDPPTLAMLRHVRTPVDMLVPELVHNATAVQKVTCFWKDAADRDALWQAIDEVGGFSPAQGDPKDVEIAAKGVSKGSALEWLCAHVGLNASDAVAFGDEENDLSLLLAAGHGVAMANAMASVLAAANDIAPTNDEAGVAVYMEQLLRPGA